MFTTATTTLVTALLYKLYVLARKRSDFCTTEVSLSA